MYYLVGHEILNEMVYFVCYFNGYFVHNWQKCLQNGKKNGNVKLKLN